MRLTANAHVLPETEFKVLLFSEPRNFVLVEVGALSLFFQDEAKLAELRDALDAHLGREAKAAA